MPHLICADRLIRFRWLAEDDGAWLGVYAAGIENRESIEILRSQATDFGVVIDALERLPGTPPEISCGSLLPHVEAWLGNLYGLHLDARNGTQTDVLARKVWEQAYLAQFASELQELFARAEPERLRWLHAELTAAQWHDPWYSEKLWLRRDLDRWLSISR